MRSLALVIYLTGLGACGSAPHRPTATVGAMTPGRDLALARTAAPRAEVQEPHDPGQTARDPRVVDLDILRITAHAGAPGAEPELTSVASADLFKQANEAAKAGHPRDAIAAY